MKPRLWSLPSLFVLALGWGASGAAAPNFLVFVADDMRADAIAAHGNRVVRTPILDRLAAEGISFREAHCMGGTSGAICVASRAMLMSGLGLFRIKNTLDGQQTLPELLGHHGYETFLAGKWHNGRPSCARSFQRGEAVFLGGMTDQFHPRLASIDNHTLGASKPSAEYSTDAIADAAARFLRARSAAKPFFAWVSFTVPHDPRTPRSEPAPRYDPDAIPLPANFLPQHPFDNGWLNVRDEELLDWPLTPRVIQRELAAYYAMISHLDARIGSVIEALGPAASDTFVIFLSDHGLALGSHGLLGKQNLYDHSMRAPLIVRGPGVPGGRESKALVYLHDLHATIRTLAGVPEPPHAPEGGDRVFYSRDLSPIWRDGETTLRDELILGLTDTIRAVRTPRLKLIRYPQFDVTQLFDLHADPDERNDLSTTHPAEVAALRRVLELKQPEAGDTAPWTAATVKPKAVDLTGRRANPKAIKPAPESGG